MSDLVLLLITLAVTAVGLTGSWAAYRRGGAASALRGLSWSLVPMAALLTGLTEWLAGLALNPLRWAGVLLAGLAGLLYVVSGVMLSRRSARGEPGPAEPARRRAATGRTSREVTRGSTGGPALDQDLAEVEEILRRRGIR